MNLLKQEENLSSSERKIADYIIANPLAVINMTAEELASTTYCSSTTVIRLCKKLDIKGFSDFKLKLAYEINTFVEKQLTVEVDPLSKDDNIFNIAGKVSKIHIEAINETRVMLDMNVVKKVVEYIVRAQQIDFYCMGLNTLSAEDAAYKFNRIGKKAYANPSLNFQYAQLLNSTKDCIAILISGSGENTFIVDAAKKLKKLKVKTVVITCNQDSTLARICDEYLIAVNREKFMRLGTITTRESYNYILDVLFCATYVNDYEHNVEKFGEFEELAKNLLFPN
ncbi:MAG: MurR/RpiR family transcriptional regulator [Clostridiaceae bacterium]